MTRKMERPRLTAAQRIEIRTKYDKGGITYQELADQYGVHKSTVARILKRDQPKPSSSSLESQITAPPQPISTNDDGEVEVDPVLFRQFKLWEISQDIQSTRDRGSLHALPQFHRLHLQVHDEWVQLKADREEFDGMTDPNEVLHQISIAVQGLPPILKDRLIDMLTGEYSNVIPLKFGGDS
jgi:transposase-like protein